MLNTASLSIFILTGGGVALGIALVCGYLYVRERFPLSRMA